jgi:hypothetical protein
MRDNNQITGGEEPRSEPEIIPPQAGTRSQWRDAVWISVDKRGTRPIYVKRLGPFGVILLALAVGLVAAFLLVLLVGALLLWIPVVAVLVTVAIISTLMRPSSQRWR